MALKNGSSATLGIPELIDLVEAFEVQNTVKVSLRAQLTIAGGKRDLMWVAAAHETTRTEPGQLPLAYASVRCLEKRLVTMEAVLLQLLYALDFQLAQLEMEGRNKSA